MTNERNLKTEEILPFDEMVEHNLAAYALATRDEALYQEGYHWYDNENENCKDAVKRLVEAGTPCTLEQFCQIVSIISPGRRWADNIKDAYATVRAYHLGSTEAERVAILSEWKVSRRYGLPCFRRAWNLLSGQYALEKKGSPKTFSFAHNLAHPKDSQEITIDQHNCHIHLGEWDIYGSISISPSQYKKLAPVIQHCADLLGIEAHRFQSVVWHWRINNLGVNPLLSVNSKKDA